MVSKSGLFPAGVFVPAPHFARAEPGAGVRQDSEPWLLAAVLAKPFSLFASALAATALKKTERPPSSPGNAATVLLGWT